MNIHVCQSRRLRQCVALNEWGTEESGCAVEIIFCLLYCSTFYDSVSIFRSWACLPLLRWWIQLFAEPSFQYSGGYRVAFFEIDKHRERIFHDAPIHYIAAIVEDSAAQLAKNEENKKSAKTPQFSLSLRWILWRWKDFIYLISEPESDELRLPRSRKVF